MDKFRAILLSVILMLSWCRPALVEIVSPEEASSVSTETDEISEAPTENMVEPNPPPKETDESENTSAEDPLYTPAIESEKSDEPADPSTESVSPNISPEPENSSLPEEISPSPSSETTKIPFSLVFVFADPEAEYLVMTIDEKAIPEFIVTPVDAMIHWESKDEKLAIVSDEGEITALDAGETIITATFPDASSFDLHLIILDASPSLEIVSTKSPKNQTAPLSEILSSFLDTYATLALESNQPLDLSLLDNGLGVAISTENFPDNAFHAYVADQFDTNADGYLSNSEITGVDIIETRGLGITSFQGIAHFTNLKTVNVYQNPLSTLELTNHPGITEINIGLCELSSLSISHMSNLKTLRCNTNKLNELNLINLPSLGVLGCSENQLPSLNLSGVPSLYHLGCSENLLSSLDLSAVPHLEYLNCSDNEITSLNLKSVPKLRGLYCGKNKLSSLDFSNNPSTEYLECANNQISSLDLSNAQTLISLDCQNNQISSLQLGSIESLSSLNCSINRISSLVLGSAPNLGILSCNNNQIPILDITGAPNLTDLYCSSNQLTSLDVSHLSRLSRLACGFNKLTTLDVTRNTELLSVFCHANSLTTLDLSKCLKLLPSPVPSEDYMSQSATSSISVKDGASSFSLLSLMDESQLQRVHSLSSDVTMQFDPASGLITFTDIPADRTSLVLSYTYDTLAPDEITHRQMPIMVSLTLLPQVPNTPLEAFVYRLYQNVLGRAPDTSWDTWINGLISGQETGASACRGFFLSPEFEMKSVSNNDFVILAYRTCMNREPAADEIAHWVNQLVQGMSRSDILDGFIISAEYGLICDSYGIKRGEISGGGTGGNAGITGFVERMYILVLNRPAEAEGVAHWSNLLLTEQETGKGMAYSFFFSTEFLNAGLDDDAFLRIMYRALLGREADAEGMQAWRNEIALNGRTGIFNGFADSIEFSLIMTGYGIK